MKITESRSKSTGILIVKKNLFLFILSFFTALCSNSSQLIWTYLIGILVDTIMSGELLSTALLITLGCFVIINASAQYVNQLTGRYTAERSAHTLRVGFIRHLIYGDNNATVSVSDTEPTVNTDASASIHAAMSTAQNELMQASEYMNSRLFDITDMLLTFVFVTVFLFSNNIILTLSIILPTIPILLFVRYTSGKITPLVNAAQNEKKELNKIAFGTVQNYPAVAVFDSKKFLREKYHANLSLWTKFETKQERVCAVCMSSSGLLSMVPLLVLLLTGGLMVLNNRITLGTLIIFLNMQKSLSQSLMNLPSWIASFKQFIANLNRIEISL